MLKGIGYAAYGCSSGPPKQVSERSDSKGQLSKTGTRKSSCPNTSSPESCPRRSAPKGEPAGQPMTRAMPSSTPLLYQQSPMNAGKMPDFAASQCAGKIFLDRRRLACYTIRVQKRRISVLTRSESVNGFIKCMVWLRAVWRRKLRCAFYRTDGESVLFHSITEVRPSPAARGRRIAEIPFGRCFDN